MSYWKISSLTETKPEIDNVWCYNLDSGRVIDSFPAIGLPLTIPIALYIREV